MCDCSVAFKRALSGFVVATTELPDTSARRNLKTQLLNSVAG